MSKWAEWGKDKGGYMGSGLDKPTFILSWIGIFVCIGVIVTCVTLILSGG